MQSFLEQLPALIGVLLGAIGAYSVTALTERKRWKRQLATRWDERRVMAYMEYAHAIKKTISICLKLASQRDMGVELKFLAPEYSDSDLAAAEEDRTVSWEAVLLFGSDEAIAAGRKWHESVFRLELIAGGQEADLPLNLAIEATSRARGEFYRVVKREIGMRETGAPGTYDWQLNNFLGKLSGPSPTESLPTREAKPELGRPSGDA
ncbi:hypothetical protein HII36_52155 [Nonomuraea sp. NN258]|uniref:hypothetical protein n=1 Tax=Nonomuraea antri TaxID=2730852 RepID=UPI0015686851|nr:hypothetical protein [Nonomuraea antri]NRQ40323.1 hypothetical protein [Nonomuraea antri]